MRTHWDVWISSAGREWRAVLALIGPLLCSAPAAEADTGWAPTATPGITLANFTIPTQPLGPLSDTTPLRIVVGLRPQKELQLNSALLAVNTPGNSAYGRFLTPSQFPASHSPSSTQMQAVESYLASTGPTNKAASSGDSP
jgi:hypothetical protein